MVKSWKEFTAKRANALLGHTGSFWAKDYFDRVVRDEEHLARVVRYIEQNPVRAGLAPNAEAWFASSAARSRCTH